ncbi:GNAT family N-acetyltransferase [Vineibacter terrae]|uniref:GNAT family N-acetyltransferase n=1 Tax=Vineibacter terrae TaxID=2586908 RepID=UPI002E2F19DF|nr:GNAT family N-acetyltransferase [Vineibacter terrae]HEX2891052.1 GNAT family N-acetyltransferase [Vineibacter terrae]
MTDRFVVRSMSRAELDLAIDWAAAEGWNPGLADAPAFHAADPGGFLVGLRDGVPAACISVVRYGSDFGFLGFYIAHPSARGQGCGIRVWDAGMARLSGRLVGLDGVPAQQDNYRKSGFTLAWRNIRFEGTPPGRAAPPAGIVLADAASLPFEPLAAFDRQFFPAPRDAFLSLWLALPGHRARVALRDGTLAGLAVARPCRRGTKIGPLYAADTGIAAALLGDLSAAISEGPIVLDVPESNPAAVRMAESFGFKAAFETARMYTAAAPVIDLRNLFGVTTFELG